MISQLSEKSRNPTDSSQSNSSENHRRSANWDIRSAPKNYLALIGSQAATSLLSFAAVWLITHTLGPEGYGGIIAIIAASQLIIQMTTHWTSVSLWRFGCEEFVETGSIAKAFWARLSILFPSLFLVMGTAYWWLSPLGSWLQIPSGIRMLIPAHCLVTVLWLHIQAALQSAKLPRLLGILLTVERIVIFVGILAFVFINQSSVLAIAVVYIAAPLIPAITGLWRIRSLITPVFSTNQLMLRQMMKFSLPLIPTALIGYFETNYLDVFFISRYLSVTEVGTYSVAYQVVGTLLQLPVLCNSLLISLFVTLQTERQEVRQNRYLDDVLPLVTLLWSVGAAVVAFSAGYFVLLLFGAKFENATTLLWPLMAAAGFAGPVLFGYSAFSNAQSATRINARAALLSSVCNVGLNILLIPRYGLVGCAWATTVAFGASMLIFSSVHPGIISKRLYVIEATTPVVLGAAYQSRSSDPFGGLAVAMFAAVVIVAIRRKKILNGVFALNNSFLLSKQNEKQRLFIKRGEVENAS